MSGKSSSGVTELVEISSDSDSENDFKVSRTKDFKSQKENVDRKPITATGTGTATTTAWKGLMGLMQANQRSSILVGKKTATAGRGLKRTATSSQSIKIRGDSGNTDTDNENTDSPKSSLVVVTKKPKIEDVELLTDENANNSAIPSIAIESKLESKSFATAATVTPRTIAATVTVRSEQPKYEKVFPIFGPKGSEKPEAVTLMKPVPVGSLFKTVSSTAGNGNSSNSWNQEKIHISLNISNNGGNEPSTSNGNKNANKKQCPFYKKIPDTAFSVDAFNYGVIPGIDVYFLSHFHSDHYIGLTKKFAKTLICSPATANLVKMKIGVSDECIRKLELDTIYSIQGTHVVLIDANHCPGSVMFIFRLPNGKIIFHTGDFRFTPDMLENPFVSSLTKVDCIYLDTTYCDPKFDFPSQTEAIAEVLESVRRHIEYRPKTLIVCGAYCIGKERVFFTLAQALNLKVFCEPDKRRVIRALETPEYLPLMEDVEIACDIHVLPMRFLNPTFLAEYLSSRTSFFNNILAVKPTGWEFTRTGKGLHSKKFLNDTITIIGVPYSEHSSFSELREFVSTIRPYKVQPTVNVGSEPKRAAMNTFFNSWLSRGN